MFVHTYVTVHLKPISSIAVSKCSIRHNRPRVMQIAIVCDFGLMKLSDLLVNSIEWNADTSYLARAHTEIVMNIVGCSDL